MAVAELHAIDPTLKRPTSSGRLFFWRSRGVHTISRRQRQQLTARMTKFPLNCTSRGLAEPVRIAALLDFNGYTERTVDREIVPKSNMRNTSCTTATTSKQSIRLGE